MLICVNEANSFNTYMEYPDYGYKVSNMGTPPLVIEGHKVPSHTLVDGVKSVEEGNTIKKIFFKDIGELLSTAKEDEEMVVEVRLEDTYTNSNYIPVLEDASRITYLLDLVDIDDIDSLKYIHSEYVLDSQSNIDRVIEHTSTDTIAYLKDKHIRHRIKLAYENLRNRPWFYSKVGKIGDIIYLKYLDKISDGKQVILTKFRQNELVSVAVSRLLPSMKVEDYLEVSLTPIYNSETRSEVVVGDVKLLTYKNGSYGIEYNNIFTPYPNTETSGSIFIGIHYTSDKIHIFYEHVLIVSIDKSLAFPFRIDFDHTIVNNGVGETVIDNITITEKIIHRTHFIEDIINQY